MTVVDTMATLRELKNLLPESGAGVVLPNDKKPTPKELEVGLTLLCSTPARGNQPHPAEIVEMRGIKDQETQMEQTMYYVHFINCDKRLDEWVGRENLDLDSIDQTTKMVASLNPLSPMSPDNKVTRQRKHVHDELTVAQQNVEDLPATMRAFELQHEAATKVRNLDTVTLGGYEIDVWYYSPYEEVMDLPTLTLWVCEYTLKPFCDPKAIERHKLKVMQGKVLRHPPGTEVYRDDGASRSHPQLCFWEVDGAKSKIYCQYLCLLAKLFLDHKTLYWEVESFMFYILTESDSYGGHRIVGYFSKEKETPYDYNLACILTLPSFQRKGYGYLMISLSYELSKMEGKKGSPEKPLSDLGQVSYKAFWKHALLDILATQKDVTLETLSDMTGFRMEDVVWTLQNLNLVRYYRGEYTLANNSKAVEEARTGASQAESGQGSPKEWTKNSKADKKERLVFKPDKLRWIPTLPEQPVTSRKRSYHSV
eukprot:TRINITY_DN55020_c0_g1_i2.p1 TRINITY_DN55020_c0_g1~~TRINITY_DN55020_c0_g1_i2.p1  ORF type:complete len:481 (-),score=97.98 TRINITY_DN55020_c0_g1_i2:23-1465(-)